MGKIKLLAVAAAYSPNQISNDNSGKLPFQERISSLLSLCECPLASSLDIKDSKYTPPEVWVMIGKIKLLAVAAAGI